MRKLIPTATLGLLLIGLVAYNYTPEPDPAMINLAVRATLHALPSSTPQMVEVTRLVEVTRIIEVTRVVAATPEPPTPTPTSSPTPSPAPAAESASVRVASATVPEQQTIEPSEPQFEPLPAQDFACPASSDRQYGLIPIVGSPTDHPDTLHGDLNLALRGYEPVEAYLNLVSITGPTDGDPPQLNRLFADSRVPVFSTAHRVRQWNWGCAEHGCRGEPVQRVEVSLIGMQVAPGESIHTPARSAEIYGGGFTALVLYAEARRITLGYTREDSVANGYVVHIEEFCVDPNLLAQYQAANANGRGSLPALRSGEIMGAAVAGEIAVAVRDRGAFTDPRSRKDWWQGS